MAIRKIRLDEDPILRKISRKVEVFDQKLKQLAEDMIETMKNADGAGLAAPQIGVLKRLVVIHKSTNDENEDILVLVNPEPIDESGKQEEIEGCLSIPGRMGKVERPNYVKFSYQDLDGNPDSIEGEGYLARVLCHEYDHLNGVLYIDKMTEEIFDRDEE